ncbi:cupin domain-containing protein [Spirosoma areae]
MKSTIHQTPILPKGDPAPEDYFTGKAWAKYLVPDHDKLHVMVLNVDFEAGARNYWHSHPGGQILIATAGTDYYQERGKPIQVLQKGDVVPILPDIEHWHGASPDSEFTHIAINTNTDKGIVVWLDRVTDEEYPNSTEEV